MKQKHVRFGICMLLTGLISVLSGVQAAAEIYGAGTQQNPYYGTVVPGDRFRPEVYLKNLSTTDGAAIELACKYEAKQYHAEAELGGGHFADGSSTRRISVRYGEPLKAVLTQQLGETPVQEGRFFSGWYLPGNHRLSQLTPQGICIPGERGDALILSETRYLIANDDPADRSATDLSANGLPQIHAIWRNNSSFPPDGKEAQITVPAGSQPDDLWDRGNQNTKLLETIASVKLAEEYSQLHGTTAYQYSRVRLNAKTDYAVNYQWYLRRRGAEAEELLQEGERAYRLTLSDLDRKDDHMQIRCVVTIGDGNSAAGTDGGKDGGAPAESGRGEPEGAGAGALASRQLCYETELRVYYLPEITGTILTADGAAL